MTSHKVCTVYYQDFPNSACFDVHLTSGSKSEAICHTIKCSKMCHKTLIWISAKNLTNAVKHIVQFVKVSGVPRIGDICGSTDEKPRDKVLFVYFDIETKQEKKSQFVVTRTKSMRGTTIVLCL